MQQHTDGHHSKLEVACYNQSLNVQPVVRSEVVTLDDRSLDD
jgi:hypothetical protein